MNPTWPMLTAGVEIYIKRDREIDQWYDTVYEIYTAMEAVRCAEQSRAYIEDRKRHPDDGMIHDEGGTAIGRVGPVEIGDGSEEE